ncbi:hypothetical protein NP238_18805 [Burkholderia gladioli]|nr:hypothetical protein [Burkholderia gladioli]
MAIELLLNTQGMWEGPRREPGRRSAATLPERRAGLAARASNERDASRAMPDIARTIGKRVLDERGGEQGALPVAAASSC